MNVRKSDIRNNGDIDIHKFINRNGYYLFPKDTWTQLSLSIQEKVKKFNSDLRKKRKNNNNDDGSGDPAEQPITNRKLNVVK